MKVPDTIYLQTCGDCGGLDCCNCTFEELEDSEQVTWCKHKINDSDTAYFSEGAVRELLQKEYEQCNRAAYLVSGRKCDNLIKVEESVEDAIQRLKGGKQ